MKDKYLFLAILGVPYHLFSWLVIGLPLMNSGPIDLYFYKIWKNVFFGLYIVVTIGLSIVVAKDIKSSWWKALFVSIIPLLIYGLLALSINTVVDRVKKIQKSSSSNTMQALSTNINFSHPRFSTQNQNLLVTFPFKSSIEKFAFIDFKRTFKFKIRDCRNTYPEINAIVPRDGKYSKDTWLQMNDNKSFSTGDYDLYVVVDISYCSGREIDINLISYEPNGKEISSLFKSFSIMR